MTPLPTLEDWRTAGRPERGVAIEVNWGDMVRAFCGGSVERYVALYAEPWNKLGKPWRPVGRCACRYCQVLT